MRWQEVAATVLALAAAWHVYHPVLGVLRVAEDHLRCRLSADDDVIVRCAVNRVFPGYYESVSIKPIHEVDGYTHSGNHVYLATGVRPSGKEAMWVVKIYYPLRANDYRPKRDQLLAEQAAEEMRVASVLATPFGATISAYIDGHTLLGALRGNSPWQHDLALEMMYSYGRELARIHAIRPRPASPSNVRHIASEIMQTCPDNGTLATCMAMAQEAHVWNATVSLVRGDAHIGNVIFLPDGPTGPNHLQVVHTDVEMSIGFAELEWAKARGTIARAYAQHYPGHHLDPAFVKELQDSFDEGYGPQRNPGLAALAAYLRQLQYQ